jgi:hypothetical protein
LTTARNPRPPLSAIHTFKLQCNKSKDIDFPSGNSLASPLEVTVNVLQLLSSTLQACESQIKKHKNEMILLFRQFPKSRRVVASQMNPTKTYSNVCRVEGLFDVLENVDVDVCKESELVLLLLLRLILLVDDVVEEDSVAFGDDMFVVAVINVVELLLP